MHHYGIIGKPLKQSFSAKYFSEKFEREGIDAEYSLYPLEAIEEVCPLLRSLRGMNVTIPYKQAVIPYLDRLDDTAAKIGAVNVVKQLKDANGQYAGSVGYNTDAIGFIHSIRKLLRPTDKFALVLGTGGASKAVQYGLKQMGKEVTVVSRTPAAGQISYAALDEACMARHTVIVNATPLGMYPDVDAAPDIPYALVDERHLLFDCIYNPEETLFLSRGREQGAITQNGMEMLYGQAKAAWRIWNE